MPRYIVTIETRGSYVSTDSWDVDADNAETAEGIALGYAEALPITHFMDDGGSWESSVTDCEEEEADHA